MSGARVLTLALTLGAVAAACPAEPSTCAARFPAAIPVGTVPNDVAIGECAGAPVALVPASGDGRLDVVELPCGDAVASLVFAPEGGRAATPWAVAVDGERAWVTLQGHGELALVDYCAGALVDRVRPGEVLELERALHLSLPQDADGDGREESVVTRMLPRAPQAVVARDGVAFAAFTNLLEPGLSTERPPVLGPGQLARVVHRGDAAVIDAIAALPCENPQGLAWQDEALWVSCSGPLGPSADAPVAALGAGALVRVDPFTLATLELVEVGDFAPGTPALLPGALVVGSLLRPALARVAAGALVERPTAGGALESIFECAPHEGTTGVRALCTHFSGDRLLVVDVEGGDLQVNAELPVGPGGSAFRGAQALALAPPAARARGVGAVVLLGLSAELALLPVEVLP